MNYAIIGNGPAGTFAAKQIRELDSSSKIVILSQDMYPFYSRPRIPELISGKSTPERIYVFPLSWYAEKEIDLRLNTRVMGLEAERKQILLQDGEIVAYDSLLIATGSVPRNIPIQGGEGREIYTLSTAEDAIKLNRLAQRSKEAVVIGAGFVGIEAAASMAPLGVKVTVIEVCDRLLPRQLDAEGSDMIRSRLESSGISFRLSSIVERISDDNETKMVTTKDGKISRGDFVLIATGIVSSVSIAEQAGIKCNRSIVVDDRMETSVQGIYASGDAAEHNGTCYGIWPVSKEQGEIAGSNMTGRETAYRGSVPLTFLKIAGIDMASIGEIPSQAGDMVKTAVKSDTKKGIFKKAFFKDGILKGAILISDTKSASSVKQAIGKDILTTRSFWDTI